MNSVFQEGQTAIGVAVHNWGRKAMILRAINIENVPDIRPYWIYTGRYLDGKKGFIPVLREESFAPYYKPRKTVAEDTIRILTHNVLRLPGRGKEKFVIFYSCSVPKRMKAWIVDELKLITLAGRLSDFFPERQEYRRDWRFWYEHSYKDAVFYGSNTFVYKVNRPYTESKLKKLFGII